MMPKRTLLAAANHGSPLSLYNAFLHLDVGDNRSYDGTSQTWSNFIASPADGSPKTAYDFYRGADNTATTDDPTFNGVAGARSINEYWSFDGGDWFKFGGSNTTFINSLHKAGAKFTIIVWIKTNSTSVGTVPLFCTINATSGETGILFEIAGSSQPELFVRGTAGSTVLNAFGNASTFTTNSYYMIAVSIDEAAGAGGSFYYINGASQTAFNGSYSSPSTNAATFTPSIGANANGTNKIANGNTRLFQVSLHNTNLNTTKLGQIYNLYKSRYELS